MSNSFPASTATGPLRDGREPWTRWWIPEELWTAAGTDQDFLSDYGLPAGTDNPFGDPVPGIAPLPHWKDEPFLLLLGRPGSGKSEEMRRAAAEDWLGPSIVRSAKEIAPDPAASLDRLIAQRSPAPGTRLIIDGLDEALLVNAGFTELLCAWFRERAASGGPPDLKLAIACRWADWPRGPVESLAALWTSHPVKLVLGPLRRADAANTLKSLLGDEKADEFWRQMHTHHLVPLACWPQSFLAMLEEFASTGRVARSHTEAMEAEIRRRCVLADSRDDRTRRERSVHEAEWRQRVAGRIASLMTFSGRQSFHTDPAGSSSVLSAAEITEGAPEAFGQSRRDVTAADVDSVISASSLIRQTDSGYAFAHQVYQEVLTAQWLDAQKTDVRRLAQLFGYEENGQWLSFPNLAAVAAGLAAKPEQLPFRQFLLEHDPLILLRLDAVALSESERRKLFKALLKRTAEIKTVDPGERHAHWPSLKYKEASADIAALLRDPHAHEAAKELALDAARGMELTDLAPVLWEVYPGASKRLKLEIARALLILAKEGSQVQWRSVLLGDIESDDHGTLLGAALEIMVPRQIPVRDVLRWIISKREFSVIGRYELMRNKMHTRLTVEDVAPLLRELAAHYHGPVDGRAISDLNISALKLAFAHFDKEEIRAAVGDYWYHCLPRHIHPHHAHNEKWSEATLGLEDDSKRRGIVKFLLLHEGFEKYHGKLFLSADDLLLRERDFGWLLEELADGDAHAEKPFAEIAITMLRFGCRGWRNYEGALQAAWQKCSRLREFLPRPGEGETILDAITRSDLEREASIAERELKERQEFEQQEQEYEQELADYESGCHAAHEKGNLVWPGAFHILVSRGSFGGGDRIDFSALEKLTAGDHWMRDAARRYLLEHPARIGDKMESEDGMLGVLALAVCATDLTLNSELKRTVGSEWLPAMLRTLCTVCLGDIPDSVSISRLAVVFSDDFAGTFKKFVRGAYRSESALFEIRMFFDVWSEEMSRGVAEVLREERIAPRGFVNALRYLAEKSPDEAVRTARHFLERFPSDREQQAALLGAATYFLHGRLWNELVPLLSAETNPERLLEATNAATGSVDFDDRLSLSLWPDTAVKGLANALAQVFPRLERRRGTRFEWRKTDWEDEVYRVRDQVASEAISRGLDLAMPAPREGEDQETQDSRERIAAWRRHAARKARAGLAWHPTPPADILRLATRPSARLARTADELMAAVVECLEAYEAEMIRNRWDELWNGTKAKDEKRIARHICEWLKQSKEVLALREVEMPDASRSDIHICGPVSPGGQPLAVIIEVKKVRRSNAKERSIAMRTQLLERYLTPNHAAEGWTHGLYLVAWTPEPESVQDTDESLEKAKQSLRRQAEELSTSPFVLRSFVLDVRHRSRAREERDHSAWEFDARRSPKRARVGRSDDRKTKPRA